MDEKWKKRKRGSITEDRIYTLLQRYSVKTVLQLLREVAISATERVDWNEIVKNTTTGISSAREYQMLWRHLAYGLALTDQFDENMNPLDDDSDLEYETEAFPVVSWESSMEASACVKQLDVFFGSHDKSTGRSVFLEHDLVEYFLRAIRQNKALVASDYPIDSHVPNNLTVEAPLTINVPMFKVPTDSSLPANAMQGTNVIIPVSVQKEPFSCGTSGEKRSNGKSGADVPPRRKRKVWSTEDDLKLTAAVPKYGEQNWSIIAADVFKNDRTPEELSLRWSSIRKKKGNLNTGTSAELSEAHKAATRAIFLALEPKGNNLKAARQMYNFGTKPTQHESQIASAPPSDPQLGMAGPPKSQVLTERPPINCTTSPTSMIKVAAVAAGARIATRADASHVIEAAARSQNVVHISTGASSLTRSSITTNQLFSNFNRKGPTKAKVSAFPSTVPVLQHSIVKEAHVNSKKPTQLTVQPNSVGAAVVSDVSSVKINATASIPSKVVKAAEVAGVSTSASGVKKLVQRVQVAGLVNISPNATVDLISEDQSASIGNLSKPEFDKGTSASGNTLGGNTLGDQASISLSCPVNQTQDLQVALSCPGVEDNGKKHGDTITRGKEIHDNMSFNGKHDNLSCKSLNGDGEASTVEKQQHPSKDEANA